MAAPSLSAADAAAVEKAAIGGLGYNDAGRAAGKAAVTAGGGITKDPVTMAPLTSSSGTARTEEANTGKAITTASDPAYLSPANNTAYIDSYIEQLHQRRATEEANINASSDASKKALEGEQSSETGQTSAMIARAGGYLGVSASGTGVLINLAQRHRNEMQALEGKRQQALSDARTAYEDKDFQLASAKMADAKASEQEAYTRKQTYLKGVAEQNALQSKQDNQVSIYNAIAGGTTDPAEIFQKLGGTVPVEEITHFLGAVTPKDGNGAPAYTPAQTAHLIGAGLSVQDIKAAQDYINANGYTEEFRSQLTPTQKVAFDAVYREKAAGGVGGTLSIAEAKSLGLPVSLISKSQAQVIADLNNPTPPEWYREYVTANWADPKAEVNPEGLAKDWQAFRTKVLAQNVEGNPYEVNAPKGSGSGGASAAGDAYSGL